jgi:hypothetical protein
MRLEASRDLRAPIEALDHGGLLVRIKHPFNKDTELHPLVRLQFRGLPEEARKAFCSKTSRNCNRQCDQLDGYAPCT